MLIKSHEQLNQAVCEIFFSSQLSKMGFRFYNSVKSSFSQKKINART